MAAPGRALRGPSFGTETSVTGGVAGGVVGGVLRSAGWVAGGVVVPPSPARGVRSALMSTTSPASTNNATPSVTPMISGALLFLPGGW
ncbi:hypothetical protein DMB42_41255 [Nonomuraea sp. WAC 01424]|nr:hypothetical protein DMB42_41255 [Nonomuraea sp. WAC 01424]